MDEATHTLICSFFWLVGFDRVVRIAGERAIGAWCFEFKISFSICSPFGQWNHVVDVLSSTVNALFVHLVSCTLSIHSVFMFASVKLLLVFFFVWSGFGYVGHGVTFAFDWLLLALRECQKLGCQELHLEFFLQRRCRTL